MNHHTSAMKYLKLNQITVADRIVAKKKDRTIPQLTDPKKQEIGSVSFFYNCVFFSIIMFSIILSAAMISD